MRPADIERSELEFAPISGGDVCPAGQSKSFIIVFPESLWVRGGRLVTDDNSVYGDWIEIQAVDALELIPVDYRTLLYPNWPILKNWVPKWIFNWRAKADAITLPYMGKVWAGFALKITYHSTGQNDVGFSLNTDSHREL